MYSVEFLYGTQSELNELLSQTGLFSLDYELVRVGFNYLSPVSISTARRNEGQIQATFRILSSLV